MLESLICNSCGAPIRVEGSARFVTCMHCKANLQIKRSDGGITTEAVEKLVETTEELAQQVDRLTKQNEVAELDRRWERDKESFMIQTKDGRRQLPTQSGAILAGSVTTFFGILWTIMAFAITQSAPDFGPFKVAKFIFPLFGVGFVLFGIFTAMSAHQAAEKYRNAERDYRRRRTELERED